MVTWSDCNFTTEWFYIPRLVWWWTYNSRNHGLLLHILLLCVEYFYISLHRVWSSSTIRWSDCIFLTEWLYIPCLVWWWTYSLSRHYGLILHILLLCVECFYISLRRVWSDSTTHYLGGFHYNQSCGLLVTSMLSITEMLGDNHSCCWWTLKQWLLEILENLLDTI